MSIISYFTYKTPKHKSKELICYLTIIKYKALESLILFLLFDGAEHYASVYMSEPTMVRDTDARCARVDGLSLHCYLIKLPFRQFSKILSGDCKLHLPFPCFEFQLHSYIYASVICRTWIVKSLHAMSHFSLTPFLKHVQRQPEESNII